MAFPFRWLAEQNRGIHCENVPPQKSAPLRPPPGCCQSLVSYRDRFLILFGGGSLYRFSNEVFVYDLESRSWACRQPENSDIVAPRLGHSAVVYKDTMIVYGGQDLHSPVVYDEVLQLDLLHWRWSLLHHAPPFPEGPGARRLHSAHVIADCMYVLLGAPFERNESFVWSLDLRAGVWRDTHPTILSLSTLSCASRLRWEEEPLLHDGDQTRLCGCCTALSGNCVYVFGGYVVQDGEAGYNHGPLTYAQTLYEFNAARNTWRLMRPAQPFPLPPRRYAAAMVAHGGHVYVFGGDANQEDVAWYFDDVWRISVSASSRGNGYDGGSAGVWERVAVAGTGPSPRSGCAYAYARSSLYLVGGERGPMELLRSESYSDEMFALPLGYSCTLSLRENVARWIGLPVFSPSATSRYRTSWPNLRLSLGARQALEPYLKG
jgi:hypothetical protein